MAPVLWDTQAWVYLEVTGTLMAENTSWCALVPATEARGHGWDLTCSFMVEGVRHNKEQSCREMDPFLIKRTANKFLNAVFPGC